MVFFSFTLARVPVIVVRKKKHGYFMEIQLNLFEEIDEVAALKIELAQVKASSEAVTKGLFARHNELAKMYLELKKQLEEYGSNPFLAKGQ